MDSLLGFNDEPQRKRFTKRSVREESYDSDIVIKVFLSQGEGIT